MSNLRDELFKNADPEYKIFNDGLTNTGLKTIGVRVPVLRQIAKKYSGEIDAIFAWVSENEPSYEEVSALGMAIVSAKIPIEKRIGYLRRWLGLVDSWALTDAAVYSLKTAENREYFEFLRELTTDNREFFVRYGVVGLFKFIGAIPGEVLEIYKRIEFGAYYIDMAVAWGMCEILIKSYDTGVKALEDGVFPVFVHNKAIRKAVESYRVTPEQKLYLKTLKR